MIKRFLKRFAKCIVCFACVLGLLNVTNEPAKAVFIESAVAASAIQFISSVLVVSGGYFVLSGDAQRVANEIYNDIKNFDQDLYDKILNFASAFVNSFVPGFSGVFRLSKELFDGIKSHYDKLYSDTSDIDIDGTSFVYSNNPYVMDYMDYKDNFDAYIPYLSQAFSGVKYLIFGRYHVKKGGIPQNDFFISYVYYLDRCKSCSDFCYNLIGINFSDGAFTDTYVVNHNKCDNLDSLNRILAGGLFCSDFYLSRGWLADPNYRIVANITNINGDILSLKHNLFSTHDMSDHISDYACTSSTYPGDLVYPGEDVVIALPDIPDSMPDDGTIPVLPPLVLNPQDIVGDIPEEKLEDISFDTPLPADEVGAEIGSGTLPDVDTGEGDNTKPDNPPIDTPTDDTGGILDILKDFFDSPSDFKLDFDAFKNIILLDRFPFCIPFDFIDSVKAFSMPAQDLKFTIAFDTKFLDVNHTVDLSPYQVPIKFFRATASVWFAVVLILKTRDLIKW